MPLFGSGRGPRPVERELSAARAAAADAFALAHEQGLGLDELDHDVVLASLSSAMRCLSALLWALHEEFDHLSPSERELAIGEMVLVASTHVPTNKPPKEHVVELVDRALLNIEFVREDIPGTDDQPWRTFTELDASTWHLATVLHILDARALEQVLGDRPVIRTQLSGAEDLMELAVAEQRSAARERRDA
jgi:hypothetical protein